MCRWTQSLLEHGNVSKSWSLFGPRSGRMRSPPWRPSTTASPSSRPAGTSTPPGSAWSTTQAWLAPWPVSLAHLPRLAAGGRRAEPGVQGKGFGSETVLSLPHFMSSGLSPGGPVGFRECWEVGCAGWEGRPGFSVCRGWCARAYGDAKNGWENALRASGGGSRTR